MTAQAPPPPPKHLGKLTAYIAARLEQNKIKELSKKAEENRRKAEAELVDALLEAGMKSFKMDDGVSVGLRKRFDCSVNKDNNDQVEEWLRETEGDVSPFQKLVLYKPAIVKMLKDKAAKDELDETKIPDFLNLRSTPGITVRGLKALEESEDE